jgi:hypothetical protein
MGRVAFPIDVVFVEPDGCIARIVHNAQPGARDKWSHHRVGAVVELGGGACRRSGVDIGHAVRIGQTYNQLRTLTDGPATEDYYGAEPLDTETPRDERGLERFKDRRLPDEAFSEAMDQPAPGWVQQMGYQSSEEMDVGPNVRFAQGLVWMPDQGNDRATESLVVVKTDIEALIGRELAPDELPVLADSLVAGGIADQARIGEGGALVLTRGRK